MTDDIKTDSEREDATTQADSDYHRLFAALDKEFATYKTLISLTILVDVVKKTKDIRVVMGK